MTAVAYLRRSRVDAARPGVVSYEQQLQAVRKLAADHGDDPDRLVILEDWGKSGRVEKQRARSAFARLEAMIESGEATVVYSYSISRLARSIEVLSRLARQCEERSIPIRCAFGHSPDISSATGRLITGILVAVDQWQAEWNAERMAEATAVRRTRGDYIGPAPYGYRVVNGKLVERPEEDVSTVVDAFREAGSAHGACRLLNNRGVPTRTGKPWHASSLWGILARVAPDELPQHRTPGRKATVVAPLAGLLLCPCGATLTPRHYPSGRFRYECRQSFDDHEHARPTSIAGSRVMPWVTAAVDDLKVPGDEVRDLDDEQRPTRDALEGRRRRVIELYKDGLIGIDERDRELVEIAASLEQMAVSEHVVPLERIDWSWPSEDVNRLLRLLIDHVVLDDRLLPASVAWRGRIAEWAS